MSDTLLEIKNLHARVAEKEIIKGLNLTIRTGEIHAIMGPNGAGKSTLSFVLAGKKDYEITDGSAFFKGKNLLDMPPEERSYAGLFLSMQHPVSIPGVTTANFLKHIVNAHRKFKGESEYDAADFLKLMRQEAQKLNVPAEMLKRELNVGFSGGEKKRLEVLQMNLLKPSLAILDETDSGLDIDALNTVADGVNSLHNKENSLLIITHHIDLLNRIQPDFVHIYADGHIIQTGTKKLAEEIEKNGYKMFLKDE